MAEENTIIQMKLLSVGEVRFMMSPEMIKDNTDPEAIQIGFSKLSPILPMDKSPLCLECVMYSVKMLFSRVSIAFLSQLLTLIVLSQLTRMEVSR